MSQSFEMLTVEEHQLYPCHPNLSSVKDPYPCCSQQCSLCLSLFHPFLCLCLLFLCPCSWAESQHSSRLGSSFCSWTIDWTSPFQTQPSVRPSPSLTDFKRKHNKHALPARGNGLSLVGWCSVGFPGVLAKRVDFNVKSTEIIALSARHEKQHSLCLKLLDAKSIKFNTSKKFSASTTMCTICLSPHLYAAGTPIAPPALPRSGAMCLCRQAFPGIHGEQVENGLKDTDMGSAMSQTPTKKLRLPCWLASGNFWNLAIKIDWKGHCLQSTFLSWTIYWSDWSELCFLPHHDLHWRIRMNESVVNTWLAASCYVNNFVGFCACVCNWWLDVLKNDILKSWGRLRSNDTTIALATGINYHSQ